MNVIRLWCLLAYSLLNTSEYGASVLLRVAQIGWLHKVLLIKTKFVLELKFVRSEFFFFFSFEKESVSKIRDALHGFSWFDALCICLCVCCCFWLFVCLFVFFVLPKEQYFVLVNHFLESLGQWRPLEWVTFKDVLMLLVR